MFCKNRRNLTVIIDVTMYLAKQGLAFRGKFEFIDVTDSSNTEKNSKNAGNFLELVKFISKYSLEFRQHVAKVCFQNELLYDI
jgi:hypothetical protein